ncbi:MAG: outer membrane beta-barrel protein [Gammaproteobacteria bacterium]|nr:outer membrane beta-barrel protein [Gammaproteobacteria bacterium]
MRVIWMSLFAACALAMRAVAAPDPTASGTVPGAAEPSVDERLPGPISAMAANTRRPLPELEVRPDVTVAAHYDSNVFATVDREASDRLLTVTPEVELRRRHPAVTMTIKAGARQTIHDRFAAENTLDYWGAAETRIDVGEGAAMFAGLDLRKEHEGRSARDARAGGIEPTGYKTLSGDLGAKLDHAKNTLRIGLTLERLEFDNVPTATGLLVNDDRDRRVVVAGLRFERRLSDEFELFGQAAYDRRMYRRRSDQLGFQRDSSGYRVAVGGKYVADGAGDFEAFVGILSQAYDDHRFRTVARPDFGARLTLDIGQRARLAAKMTRALKETTDAGTPGYLHSTVDAELKRRHSAFLRSYLGITIARADYLQTGRRDDSISLGAGLRYRIADNTTLSFGIRATDYDSTPSRVAPVENDFTRQAAYISLTHRLKGQHAD